MKALIIDDEPKARNLLRTILAESCAEVVFTYEAEDLPAGVKAIHKHHPDIVFLDVEMPGFAGTQILDFFDKSQIDFHIIFTTAYSEYAIKAFEINAISYLLKPLRTAQVREAVEKASNILSSKQINNHLKELHQTLETNSFGKIGLPISDGVLFVRLEDIHYFKAEGMYTEVIMAHDKKQIVSKPLKYFVDILAEVSFFYRTHRSYLVNIHYIKQLVRKNGNYLIMDNSDAVTVSKEKMNELIDRMRV